MVEGKLSEVDPPSNKVMGRSLLALPILEERRQRNRGEIANKGYVFGGFASQGINRRRGQPGGPPGVQAPPWQGQALGRARWPPGHLVVAPRPSFGVLETSDALIFYPIFPEFLEHF